MGRERGNSGMRDEHQEGKINECARLGQAGDLSEKFGLLGIVWRCFGLKIIKIIFK